MESEGSNSERGISACECVGLDFACAEVLAGFRADREGLKVFGGEGKG